MLNTEGKNRTVACSNFTQTVDVLVWFLWSFMVPLWKATAQTIQLCYRILNVFVEL